MKYVGKRASQIVNCYVRCKIDISTLINDACSINNKINYFKHHTVLIDRYPIYQNKFQPTKQMSTVCDMTDSWLNV